MKLKISAKITIHELVQTNTFNLKFG